MPTKITFRWSPQWFLWRTFRQSGCTSQCISDKSRPGKRRISGYDRSRINICRFHPTGRLCHKIFTIGTSQ